MLASGLLAAAALTATVPGATANAATATATAQAPDWDTTLTVADVHASDVAVAVEERAAFGGIRVTPDNSTIEVYVTHRDVALEAAARAAAGPAPLRFTTVRHSHKALRALQRRVLNDHRAGTLGARLTGAPVIDSLNRVAVEIENHSAAKETAVLARYGRGNVVVRPGVPAFETAASRMDDFAQWNSGSFIYSPQGQANTGTCSGGPGVKDTAGNEYLLSAGHCFINRLVGGTSGWDFPVYQGVKESTTLDDPVRIGTAKARYPRSFEEDMDISLMTLWDGGSGLSFVTTTHTATTPFSRPQKAPIRAVEGTPVCTSGAYSGERCGAEVDAFDDPYPAGDGTATRVHVNRAHSLTGAAIAGPGDSGGPVYQSRTDGLYVGGIISAIESPGLTCPNNNTTYSNRGTWCSDIVLFTGINSTMGHFGVTLNTR